MFARVHQSTVRPCEPAHSRPVWDMTRLANAFLFLCFTLQRPEPLSHASIPISLLLFFVLYDILCNDISR